MKRQDLRELIRGIIADRRKQIAAEIRQWDCKIRATLSYYGVGGPYRRQTAAKEKAERELEDLNRFEIQLMHTVDIDKVAVYAWYCRECGAVTLTTGWPTGDWHECGSCRKRIYGQHQNFTLEVNRACSFGSLMRRLEEEE